MCVHKLNWAYALKTGPSLSIVPTHFAVYFNQRIGSKNTLHDVSAWERTPDEELDKLRFESRNKRKPHIKTVSDSGPLRQRSNHDSPVPHNILGRLPTPPVNF